ncbi:MAG: CTP synthetase [Rhodobacteraceae bacterium]|nr:CTP synthetase [Paracoccaceae bacterium]MAY45534.1 CTP synthetase [Paracoccaceae bacterium]|tara:strand:- start:230 stop:436 length:207 start_codon:yes stop_codon:yes gene_type:complete
MLPLVLIIHIFTGATLSGVAIVLALVMGYTNGAPIIAAGLVGFLLAFPVSWFIAKAIRTTATPPQAHP